MPSLPRGVAQKYTAAMKAKDVQAFFDRVASDWDTMRLAYYDERVIERITDVSNLREGMTVADVGTGTGFVAAGVAPRVRSVVALDNSPAMLSVARENIEALGLGNVELLLGEITALPLSSDSVDAAFANMVLHHAKTPEAMLREMVRVVKPGGAVVITDEVKHPYAWMREEHADVWLGFDQEQVEDFFHGAGLIGYQYESLGMQ
jgi:ubiquinone/menaquinone biosynthesis C-methylase UbiE